MKFRLAIGSSVVGMLLWSGAMADPPAPAGESGNPAPVTQDHVAVAGTLVVGAAAVGAAVAQTVIRAAAVTREGAQIAATTGIARISAATPFAPPTGDHCAPAKANAAKTKHAGNQTLAEKPDTSDAHEARRQRLAAADEKSICVRAVGKPEMGTAAWYGGRYIGRRTSSGDRLDTIHPTAAHRTLPLNSLARVTNLNNGRSVVVRVTDRGPIDKSLLIDMSPRAADELRMKDAGLIPVSVEQVVEAPSDPQ